MKWPTLFSMLFVFNLAQATGPDTTSWEIIHQSTMDELIPGENFECVPSSVANLFQLRLTQSHEVRLNSAPEKKCPEIYGKEIKAKKTVILYLETPIDSSGNPTGEPSYLTCFINLSLENGMGMTSGYWFPQTASSCR